MRMKMVQLSVAFVQSLLHFPSFVFARDGFLSFFYCMCGWICLRLLFSILVGLVFAFENLRMFFWGAELN